jgi:hypothetical protein
MRAEIEISPRNITSRTLAVRFNGTYAATDMGHNAQELVRIHMEFKAISDPKFFYAPDRKSLEAKNKRYEELCNLFSIPADAKIREKKIQGYDSYLRRVGLPYFNFK